MDASTLVCRELREIAREIALLNQEVQLLRDTLTGLATDRKTEPKRGKWISDEVAGFKCCSCNEWNPYSSDFCPNCGADMREREGE